MYDLVVIGSGVTGYGAAMYAARLDLSVAVIGNVEGGTITLTDDVANYSWICSAHWTRAS